MGQRNSKGSCVVLPWTLLLCCCTAVLLLIPYNNNNYYYYYYSRGQRCSGAAEQECE